MEKTLVTDDIEHLVRVSIAIDNVLSKNPVYIYETSLYIGPPHKLDIKIYKNE